MNSRVKNTLSGRSAAAAENPVFHLRTIALMILIGVFSFGAYIVLSGFADDLQSGNNGGQHALSKSSVGFGGIYHILQNNGYAVDISRDSSLDYTSDGALRIVSLPVSQYFRGDLDDIDLDSPTLIVLPKWNTAKLPQKKGFVQKRNAPSEPVLETRKVEMAIGNVLKKPELTRTKSGTKISIKPQSRLGNKAAINIYNFDQLQTLKADDLVDIISSEQGIILGKVMDQPIYILSDPDLLNTFGVGDAQRAKLGIDILQYVSFKSGTDSYLFDLSLHGFSNSRNLIKLALTPPFLGVSLCLLAIAALISWQALMRFGAPARETREIALGKLALINNAARFIKRDGRESNFIDDYAKLNAKLVAEAVNIPSGLGQTEMTARLDSYSKHAKTDDNWTKLAARSREADNNTDLMEKARDLYKWRGDITNEHD